MSLGVQAFGSTTPLFVLIGLEFSFICAYMAYKQELFGFSIVGHPSAITNIFVPFVVWVFHYLLTCAVPMVIASAPMELGPEVFAGIIVWRLLTNGVVIYLALGSIVGAPLTFSSGMLGYGVILALTLAGLTLFFLNCDENFDRNLFWRPKSGKEHCRDCWQDEVIWTPRHKEMDSEIWGWVGHTHPTYLPFDDMSRWLCKNLVEKYEDKAVERPDWMRGKLAESLLIKRFAEIYTWKGLNMEDVNEAMDKLFGRSGNNLERRRDKMLTFIKKCASTVSSIKKSPSKSLKITPLVDDDSSSTSASAWDQSET